MSAAPTIFVFGSNRRGEHLGGAARHAVKYDGAIMGRDEGPQGTSYAIPTVASIITGHTLALDDVRLHVDRFLLYARCQPDLHFKVTRIGCGLAGFRDAQIAPLFAAAPDNCSFDLAWRPFLGDAKRYWGTF